MDSPTQTFMFEGDALHCSHLCFLVLALHRSLWCVHVVTRVVRVVCIPCRRFKKLYEDYRPGFVYWKLVLIARKFALAVVAMMLDTNPLFQVCVCHCRTCCDCCTDMMPTCAAGDPVRHAAPHGVPPSEALCALSVDARFQQRGEEHRVSSATP
jgi:hypothetical protein